MDWPLTNYCEEVTPGESALRGAGQGLTCHDVLSLTWILL